MHGPSLGGIATANEQDINHVEVERIDLRDGGFAVLTICQITNRKQVAPAAGSPAGRGVVAGRTGQLISSRSAGAVVPTTNG